MKKIWFWEFFGFKPTWVFLTFAHVSVFTHVNISS